MGSTKKLAMIGVLSSFLIVASRMLAAGAGLGPYLTPLSPFTDGLTGKTIFTVPGVIKKNGFLTEFSCTNLGIIAGNIGVEVFDNKGTQLNSVSTTPVPGATPVPGTCADSENGAVLNVPAGSTVTIATGSTAQLHEDCKMLSMPVFATGSARIVSTVKIGCTALVIDSKNAVIDPGTGLVTGRSPSITRLTMITKNKQSGD